MAPENDGAKAMSGAGKTIPDVDRVDTATWLCGCGVTLENGSVDLWARKYLKIEFSENVNLAITKKQEWRKTARQMGFSGRTPERLFEEKVKSVVGVSSVTFKTWFEKHMRKVLGHDGDVDDVKEIAIMEARVKGINQDVVSNILSEAPKIQVEPTLLNVGPLKPDMTVIEQIDVLNAGRGKLNVRAQAQQPWFVVDPIHQDVDPGERCHFTVTIHVDSNAPPTLKGQLRLRSNGGNRTLPVVVKIKQESFLKRHWRSIKFLSILVLTLAAAYPGYILVMKLMNKPHLLFIEARPPQIDIGKPLDLSAKLQPDGIPTGVHYKWEIDPPDAAGVLPLETDRPLIRLDTKDIKSTTPAITVRLQVVDDSGAFIGSAEKSIPIAKGTVALLQTEPKPKAKVPIAPRRRIMDGGESIHDFEVEDEEVEKAHHGELVKVRVTIDETGKVTGAKATSGPIAVRKYAESAARNQPFTRRRRGDQSVGFSQIITMRLKPRSR